MPRIRKKPSKRQTIQDRRKIQRKVRGGKKKKAKEAKQNPQWKSKHKKDPGIPNSFPYKEEILAEVAEQRRLAAEERQRRKDEKKAMRAAQKKAGKETEEEQDEEQDDTGDAVDEADEAIGGGEVASLVAKVI